MKFKACDNKMEKNMIEQIEISTLDLRYESFRLKSRKAEKELCSLIIDIGIKEPLQGITTDDGCKILLNGFKRYRCAKKLKIGIVPYVSFGSDEPSGLIKLIRKSNSKKLNILEQAKLIDELKNIHKMANSDIAGLLEKSQSWVSVRTDIIENMSSYVMERIFNGDFPVYSFMYTIRKFMRIKSISNQDIDDFVKAVAGKKISYREIDQLAKAFFKGPDEMRQQIKNGNIEWSISKLKKNADESTDCTKIEQEILKDFGIVLSVMQRIIVKIAGNKFESNAFYAQVTILTDNILNNTETFFKSVRNFHDKCRQA
jgi:hypothetical protein